MAAVCWNNTLAIIRSQCSCAWGDRVFCANMEDTYDNHNCPILHLLSVFQVSSAFIVFISYSNSHF